MTQNKKQRTWLRMRWWQWALVIFTPLYWSYFCYLIYENGRYPCHIKEGVVNFVYHSRGSYYVNLTGINVHTGKAANATQPISWDIGHLLSPGDSIKLSY